MLLFYAFAPLLIKADEQTRVIFTHAGESVIEDQSLLIPEQSLWRVMESNVEEYEGPVTVILNRHQKSGIAYAAGNSFPVTLLDGSPEVKRGTRIMHLYTDHDRRLLHLSDGTTRRVTDSEAGLDFPSDRITEFILTEDRQHLIRLDTSEMILVSPPVRN